MSKGSNGTRSSSSSNPRAAAVSSKSTLTLGNGKGNVKTEEFGKSLKISDFKGEDLGYGGEFTVTNKDGVILTVLTQNHFSKENNETYGTSVSVKIRNAEREASYNYEIASTFIKSSNQELNIKDEPYYDRRVIAQSLNKMMPEIVKKANQIIKVE